MEALYRKDAREVATFLRQGLDLTLLVLQKAILAPFDNGNVERP